jgi:hypothetical protein
MEKCTMKTLARLAVVLAMTVVSLSAYAQRTIDFTQPLKALDGNPMLKDGKEPWTLSDIAVGALTAQFKDEDTLPGSKKFGNYELARKVYMNKSCSLSAEEIATLKERIGKAWSTAFVGPAYLMLDPNSAGQEVPSPADKK